MKSYIHFTLSEREILYEYLNEGKSFREIARLLGRSASSISREVRRNRSKINGSYHYWRATSLYIFRRRNCVRKPAIVKGTELYNMLKWCLEQYWSPEIAAHYCKEHGLKISAMTIYRAVKAGIFDNITPKTHLRRRGKKRKGDRKKYNTIKPEHTIHERPVQANERSRLGDWEGDTIHGVRGKACLVTQVDRHSKLLTAAISDNLSKEAVRAATKRAFELLEVMLPVHTITLDNGSEFADFRGIERDLNTTVYFADPHSPWQRGLNENTNGILRFFFPKGTDFSSISEHELLDVLHLINSRPRKSLDFLSPIDFISLKCCT